MAVRAIGEDFLEGVCFCPLRSLLWGYPRAVLCAPSESRAGRPVQGRPEMQPIRVSNPQRWIGLVVVVLVLAVLPLAGIGLHFTAKAHNNAPFDIDTEFPVLGADGRPLPETKGAALATAIARVLGWELTGTGWRPNDIIFNPNWWGADNNANRQLGILLATRVTAQEFSDHLTKTQSDPYDTNLFNAQSALRNRQTQFMLPSFESKMHEAIGDLDAYSAGLRSSDAQTRSRPVNLRATELVALANAWESLLGDEHNKLLQMACPLWGKPNPADRPQIPGLENDILEEGCVPWMQTDDRFYEAQGVAHALYHYIRGVRRDYWPMLSNPNRTEPLHLLDEVSLALHVAAHIKPLVVLNGSASGLLANHLQNLEGWLVEALQKLAAFEREIGKS